MLIIDAREKACPIPVILAKKQSDNGDASFTLLVDNSTAVENLKRFGSSNNFVINVLEKDKHYEVVFKKDNAVDVPLEESAESSKQNLVDDALMVIRPPSKGWAVFVGKKGIGGGDRELGAALLKMFFYTLAQENDIPSHILFMNEGVKVTVDDDQVIEQLKRLQELGAEILVCGTCLNFYGIADKLKIGTVSNMYDIAGAMKSADKVLTI